MYMITDVPSTESIKTTDEHVSFKKIQLLYNCSVSSVQIFMSNIWTDLYGQIRITLQTLRILHYNIYCGKIMLTQYSLSLSRTRHLQSFWSQDRTKYLQKMQEKVKAKLLWLERYNNRILKQNSNFVWLSNNLTKIVFIP